MIESTNKPELQQQPILPEGATSRRMAKVLEAVEGPDRRDTIRDTIVGATLRTHGAAEGAVILRGIEGDSLKGEPTYKTLTRADGLRKSVIDAASTDDGKNALSRLGLGLRVIQGQPAMANMAQVSAYLGAITESESALDPVHAASNWKQTLADEVRAIADTPGRVSAFGNEEGLGVDSNLSGALQIAHRAGIDFSLLHRTAEYLRGQHEQGLAIGSVAVSTEVDYDRFFQ